MTKERTGGQRERTEKTGGGKFEETAANGETGAAEENSCWD